MKRLFIGVKFSDDVNDYFQTSQLMVEKYCERANYTRYDNFHLTLRFLGMIEESKVPEIVQIIKSSRNTDVAKQTLQERFGLSEIQATAIVEMRLRQLTGLEREKLENEHAELERQIPLLPRAEGRTMRPGFGSDSLCRDSAWRE